MAVLNDGAGIRVDLKAGEDFVEALARAVDSADVFILLIGRDWVDARDAHGKRRLDDPHDMHG